MELENIRKRIDKIDKQILEILSKRFALVEKINLIKKKKKVPVFDPSREQKLYQKIAKNSLDLGLSKDFTKKLFNLILEESKRLQANGK